MGDSPGRITCRLTIHSSRTSFAGRLNSGVRRHETTPRTHRFRTLRCSLAAARHPAFGAGARGVSLDATEQQIFALLGQPTSVTEELDFLNRHLHYPNLLISFSGSIVAGLFSESPDACTPAGLYPGDPLAHALTLYGAPEIAERETGTFWEYYTSFPCWLQVAPEGDRIASVRVACQP